MIIVFLIVLIFAVVFKLLYNYRRYTRMKDLLDRYVKWALKKDDADEDFIMCKAEITELLEQAGLKDIYVKGKIDKNGNHTDFKLELFERNLIHNVITERLFKEAVGKYKYEFDKAKSINYWIETIVFLPRNMLKYLGLNTNKTTVKILGAVLNFIYWVFWIVFTFYKDEVIHVVKSLVEKLA